MSKRSTLSAQTRTNWLIDVAVFSGALLATLSGIYFLFIPSGGYQGGRNAMYGITILFSRHTWGDLHTWGGLLMIAAAIIHIAIHWSWVKMMSKRILNAMQSRGSKLSRGAKVNATINLAIAVSFLWCAVSGVALLLAPSGGSQLAGESANASWGSDLIFDRTAWDVIHTWSGVALIVSAVLHLAIHWRWVKNVTRRLFQSLWQRPKIQEAPATR